MNNKTIIEFGFRRIWTILQISEGVIHTLLDLQNSSHPTQPHSIIAKYYYHQYYNQYHNQKSRRKSFWQMSRKCRTLWAYNKPTQWNSEQRIETITLNSRNKTITREKHKQTCNFWWIKQLPRLGGCNFNLCNDTNKKPYINTRLLWWLWVKTKCL